MDLRHFGLPASTGELQRHGRRASSESAIRLQDAFDYCLATARSHCPSFPTAVCILPKRLRKPVAVVYAFSHAAHEIADEGRLSPTERLMHLAAFEAKLDIVTAGGTINEPLFLALANVLAELALPVQSLYDLLTAARWDAVKKRYASFAELMEYCRYAASPLGRLLLHLCRCTTPRNIGHADALTSALQLIDKLRTLVDDCQRRNRIYLPQDEMIRFGVTAAHLEQHISDLAMQRLIKFQILRIQRLLRAGAPLGSALHGRVGLEMRLIISAAAQILQRLAVSDDPLTPPRLSKLDWGWILWQGLIRPRTLCQES
jgi:squalene synthase HpnC